MSYLLNFLRSSYSSTRRPHNQRCVFNLDALEARMLLTTFFNNLNASNGWAETATGGTWYGAQFSTDNATYNSLTATLLMSQVTAGTLIVDLYTDAGQQPGAFVGTFANPASLNSSLTAEAFTISGVSLSANTNYWIVLHSPNGAYNWGWTDDFSIKQNWVSTSNAGSTWFKSNSYPFQYSVVSGIVTDQRADEIAIRRGAVWYQDSNNSLAHDSADNVFAFGNSTDIPVKGDWNGDGYDEVGVFRDGLWYLDSNDSKVWNGLAGGDGFAKFGNPGDTPLVGDWNGDGFDDLGVVRNGRFYLDANGNGVWDGVVTGGDVVYQFGNASDTPIAGDWSGSGNDSIGVLRNGTFYLDVNNNGTWDGHATGDASFAFGIAGDKPVIGDWNNDGFDDVGIVRGRNWYLDHNGNRHWDGNSEGDAYFTYGNASGDVPLAGRWRPTGVTFAGQSTARQSSGDSMASAAATDASPQILASQLASTTNRSRAGTLAEVDEVFRSALT